MDNVNASTLLLVVALVAVATLAVILYRRLIRRQPPPATAPLLNPDRMAALWNMNSKDGTVAEVASRVSELMRTNLGCELILFLRKKRGYLVCNYACGLGTAPRYDLQVPFSKPLSDRVRESFHPRRLEEIAPLLPDPVQARLNQLAVDWFFPVFWRENLYGIYFVRGTNHTASAESLCMLASLAQVLSATYHVKWHESKRDQLEQVVDQLQKEIQTARSVPAAPPSYLHLVKQRDADTLLNKVLEAIRNDLGLDRIAYFYRTNEDRPALKMIKQGVKELLSLPNVETFEQLRETLGPDACKSIDEVDGTSDNVRGIVDNFRSGGFTSLSSFSLNGESTGILAFSGRHEVDIRERLDFHRRQVSELWQVAESYQRAEELSFTDELTGLANKRYLHKRLGEEIARASRHSRKLALIMLDLDELKGINDTYGHQAGDEILRGLGDLLRQSIRSIDIVARYGGDEFCIVMPETDGDMCIKFMTRFQGEVSRSRYSAKSCPDVACTVSLGGAVYPEHGNTVESLVYAADMALLKAKSSGRNMALLSEGKAVQDREAPA